MNILYLTTHLNIGGISSYVLSLARGFKAGGHKVYIATSGGELIGQFVDQGIDYIRIPVKTKQEFHPKVLISFFRLLSQIRDKDIDIIHSNTRVTQVLGSLLSRYSGKTHISTCHGFFKKRFSRRLFACWGDKTIAVSQAVKEHLVNDFKLKEENVRVIYSGIDVAKFRVPASPAGGQGSGCRGQRRKELGLGPGPVIGIVARLSDVKGHKYLIAAMKNVLRDFPEAQLLIVGDGREKKALVALVSSLGIRKNVFFIPSVIETSGILPAMDLFVMSSLNEGLSLSLMEAMATGLAAIGSNVGGIKNLIQHEYNGLLVSPADVEGLSSAISALLKDDRRKELLGKNARDFICNNFSQDKMVLETGELYKKCLENAKY